MCFTGLLVPVQERIISPAGRVPGPSGILSLTGKRIFVLYWLADPGQPRLRIRVWNFYIHLSVPAFGECPFRFKNGLSGNRVFPGRHISLSLCGI